MFILLIIQLIPLVVVDYTYMSAVTYACLLFQEEDHMLLNVQMHKAIALWFRALPVTGGNHMTSTLTNIPSSITTIEAIQKYLANQQY